MTVAVILAISSAPTFAEDVKGEADNCAALGTLAASIMKGRQSGVPMSNMMAIARKNEQIGSLVSAMVIAAYETPQFSGEKYRQRKVVEFQNDVMLECYKSIRN